MPQSTVEVGKGVMLKKGKNLKYVYVEHNKQEKMDNFFFTCTDMINKPFGTAFKVLNKKQLEVIDPIQVEEHRQEYEKLKADEMQEETRDNRDIVDTTETQKLDKKTIMGFREEGMAGEKIVEKLIENSATFKDRTEFSQAKYLKKKEKKYMQHFVALRPTARLLCEMYFKRAPDKILDLRPDTLAQILTYSNVQSGSKVLLMETCKGLVAGAMMDRLGADGTLLQLHPGNVPVRTITEQFNFTIEDLDRLACSFPMEKLELWKELQSTECSRETMLESILGKNYVQEPVIKNEESAEGKEERHEPVKMEEGVESVPEKQQSDDKSSEIEPETRLDNRKRKHVNGRRQDVQSHPKAPRVNYLPREKRIAECERAMDMLSAKDFDTLVIVSKYHPKKLLLTLLEFLPVARPFVVYCQFQEPLMECFVTLRDMKIVTNLEITETWCRNLQVLSNRSHPEIVMSATGGYILRGIKICP